MPTSAKSIIILYADDDPEDRMLARDAWQESHLANELHFVEDGEEFCLVYRYYGDLISRRGRVGTFGEWTVQTYPSERRAAHAYAHACSELSAEGFRDLIE